MKKFILFSIASAVFSASAFSANLASDDGSQVAYGDGWQDGDNGGSGFGAWQLSQTGDGGRYVGGTAIGSDSFGLFSNTGTSLARRDFTGGALSAGDTFSIDLGHTSTINGEIGLNLLNGASTIFTLKFTGGDSAWDLNDGGVDFGSGQNYSANTSLSFTFTYEGGNNYSYTFGSGSGSNYTATNTISNITGFQLYNNGQGSGENFGANNISVVPEPSTFALLAGLLGFIHVALRRRG